MRDNVRRMLCDPDWVYGLQASDFDYTVELARNFVSARKELLSQKAEKVRSEDPECADDILDDLGYYTGIECLYVWHFCLWRLQAILEGLMVHRFMKLQDERPIFGLKAKLSEMRSRGFSISEAELRELLDWANVRNVLSHAPPEQYRPGTLYEDDILEYCELLKDLCIRWEGELHA